MSDQKRYLLTFIAVVLVAVSLYASNSGSGILPIPVPPFIKPDFKDARVVIIEESSNISVEGAIIRNNADYWDKELPQRGLHGYPEFDPDSEFAQKYYKNQMDEFGLPLLAISSAEEKLLYAGKRPDTIQQIDEIVRKITGR